MAQIPLGQFGQAQVVPRTSGSRVDMSGVGAEARALESLGQTAMQAGVQVGRQNQQRVFAAQQESEELARAIGTNALLDHDMQIKAATSALETQVQTGDLDWRNLGEVADETFRKIEVPQIQGLAAPDAERLQGGFARARESAMLGVQALAQTAQRGEFKAQVVKARDTLGKQASDPTADVARVIELERGLRPLAVSAGLGDAFDKDSQEFADKAYSNNAKARFNVVREDPAGLESLLTDLTADGGYFHEKMDADRTNAIVSQVIVAQGRLEARDQHNLDRRERGAERAIEQMDRQIATGVQAPIDFYEGVADAVKGTGMEDAYRERLQQEVEVQGVLAKPIDQQAEFVQNLEAQQTREGATVQQQQNLARLKREVEGLGKMLTDSPLLFHSRRTGEPVPALDMQGLASGDVSEVQRQMADRMVTLRTIKGQYGERAGNAPLLPQEADALSSMLKQASPRQGSELFGALSTAINDPDAYRAAMQQIAPDSPVKAFAGIIHAAQRETTIRSAGIFRGAVKAEAGDVARTLMEGEALLSKASEDGKGGAFPMPSNTEFMAEFNTSVGKAFANRGTASQYAMQAVRAHYAGASAQAGDLGGELDMRRMRESVRAVLGEPVDINDGEVFPPWGMDGATFEDRIETQWNEARTRLPEGASRDFNLYTPVQAGSDTYMLTYDGRYLTGTDGEPIRLTVKP